MAGYRLPTKKEIEDRIGEAFPPNCSEGAPDYPSAQEKMNHASEPEADAYTPIMSVREAPGAVRHDKGKLRYDLIPPEQIAALARVFTKGAEKYDDRNWEGGMKYSRMLGSIMRHLIAYQMGERFDPETGCHHLAHVAWGALGMVTYDQRGMSDAFNDLPSYLLLRKHPGVQSSTRSGPSAEQGPPTS